MIKTFGFCLVLMLSLFNLAFSLQFRGSKHVMQRSTQTNHHLCSTLSFNFVINDFDFYGVEGTYSSEHLISIQFKFINHLTQEQKKSEIYGSSWGTPFSWQMPEGSQLATVQFWREGQFVEGLQFTTNKGQKSPLFGYNSKRLQSRDIAGKRLIGMKGVYCARGLRVMDVILQQ